MQNIIPFEIHITVSDFTNNLQNKFVDFCLKNDAKPILIELSQGDFKTQPMLSKVVFSNNLDEILSFSNDLSNSIIENEFFVKRLKIEIPSENADLFINTHSNFEKYFEWHAKIEFIQFEKLIQLCEKHKVHLSKNSLKNENDKRFITLREFGSRNEFNERIVKLTDDLLNGSWKIYKFQSEYCIYDNNEFLDAGWLPNNKNNNMKNLFVEL